MGGKQTIFQPSFTSEVCFESCAMLYRLSTIITAFSALTTAATAQLISPPPLINSPAPRPKQASGDHENNLPTTVNLRGDLSSQLIAAISSGDTRAISKLLDQRADPNKLDGRGRSPMAMAALLSDNNTLQELIAHGGNALDGGYEFPITASITRGLHMGDWQNYYTLMSHTDGKTIPRSSSEHIITRLIAIGQYDKVLDLLRRGYPTDPREQLRLIAVGVTGAAGPQGAYREKVIALLKSKDVQP